MNVIIISEADVCPTPGGAAVVISSYVVIKDEYICFCSWSQWSWSGPGPVGSVAAQEEAVAGRSPETVTESTDPRTVFHCTALTHVTLQHIGKNTGKT